MAGTPTSREHHTAPSDLGTLHEFVAASPDRPADERGDFRHLLGRRSRSRRLPGRPAYARTVVLDREHGEA